MGSVVGVGEENGSSFCKSSGSVQDGEPDKMAFGSTTPDPSDAVGDGEDGKSLSLDSPGCFSSFSSKRFVSSSEFDDDGDEEEEEEVEHVLDEVVDIVVAAHSDDESEGDATEPDDEADASSFSSVRVGDEGICFLISSKSKELTPLDSLPTGDNGVFMLLWKPMLTGEIGESNPNPSRRSPTPDIGTAILRAIMGSRQICEETDGNR